MSNVLFLGFIYLFFKLDWDSIWAVELGNEPDGYVGRFRYNGSECVMKVGVGE
jgi:hypothetical protein